MSFFSNRSIISLVGLSFASLVLIGFLIYGLNKLVFLGIKYYQDKKAAQIETDLKKRNTLDWFNENKQKIDQLHKELKDPKTTLERKTEIRQETLRLLEEWHRFSDPEKEKIR